MTTEKQPDPTVAAADATTNDVIDALDAVAKHNTNTSTNTNPIPESDGLPKPDHASLKYSLLGPSLLKAGQDSVDQSKVSEIIYSASKGSKYFNREEAKDKILTGKIDKILAKKRRLETLDLSHERRTADNLIAQLEESRDLTQHIVHIDCDAFYAAVELLDRPELADRPFAVGTGVLTTCNYVARRYGCRSGMAGFVAKKLCRELILLPLNFDKYNAKAAEVRAILADYDPRFESASIDEAFLNITSYCAAHGLTPCAAVAQLRARVHAETRITVSAGIAANARLAKICSNFNKPNGQYLLPSSRDAIMAFMRTLECRKVNGVGRVFERELAAVGIVTCGDIFPQRAFLSHLFGEKAFAFLIRCYLGLGRTAVQPADEYERKSVGTESTFRDISGPDKLRAKLRATAEELEQDMRRAECKGRTLCLKVKMHTYEVVTRQVVLPRAVWAAEDLYAFALPMLAKLEGEFPGMTLRLMGLRCTHLVSSKKPDVLVFFGLRPGRGGEKKKDDGEWEQWPEDGGGDHDDDDTPEMEGDEAECGKDERDNTPPKARGEEFIPFRRHGKEILPNPSPSRNKQPQPEPPPEEEWWDCPICSRPQTADERLFNEHIDLCLSRQAIRDTVQQDESLAQQQQQQQQSDRATSPDSSTTMKGAAAKERKRARRDDVADPRQKKLCFG
ncbi:hypothetical protein B0T22DRAFT_528672 [Podospora appendiculata]|uniref:DNA polymerase kappa n=1 Tax=Podospora appendiculata TaxID=314037 RepID=A0AAE0XC34_9PEZI|nr:hypothetical protein B0T22DRAFT_528672 [Podospora appendiculata]